MEREGSSPATRLAAAIALVALAGVWAWWAAKEGAYFGTVMYPGLIVLCAAFVLVASRSAWRSKLNLSTPAKVALCGLLGLAFWSALSALWSPAPDIAVADAQRIFAYGLAFALGIWLTTLLRADAHLAMVPMAFAGLVAGAITVAGMLGASELADYVDKGTLFYPLGYRNANAAFFLIALWPAVTLAATRELDWRLRALALATATLCIELAALSQSRGSFIACVIALGTFVVLSRERARIVGWLALATLPALMVIPALTELYDVAKIETYTGTAELHSAGRAALIGALAALPIGGVAAIIGRRIDPSDKRAAKANRSVAVGALAVVLAGVTGFVVATGDPAEWLGDRADEFFTQGSPVAQGTSRLGVDAGSERDDFWRVALEDAREDPLLGLGGGGFQYSYLLDRTDAGAESVKDAHSVPLEIASELGIPGLVLFGLAVGGGLVGAWHARRISSGAAAVSTCALVVTTYWFVHSSIDWFWTYPALTAPVFALLGAACGLAPGADRAAPAGGLRRLAAVGAVALAVTVIPPYLAERYVHAAYAGWRDDPGRAQADLDRARTLNPLSVEPIIAEGAIARERGAEEEAVAAFEEVTLKRPEDWAARYFLAALHRRTDPARARRELAAGLALNPLSADLAALEERIRTGARGGD